jgi:ribosomal protein S21
MINVEVVKGGADNTMSVLRKFTRRVQGSGLVHEMRGRRYWSRQSSKAVKKKRALKRLVRAEKYQQDLKEGKVTERPARGGRRSS